MKTKLLLATTIALALPGCASGGVSGSMFDLVKVREHKVGSDRMAVTPPREWNRLRTHNFFRDVREVEDWTLNGPYLDSLSFVSGLKDGKSIVFQRSRDIRQVPRFDKAMSAFEIADMLESYYYARGGALQFTNLELQPRTLMGYEGFQFDFEYLAGDELWHRGRAVGAVIDERFYLILLDGLKQHYFDEALPDFEAVVASARLRA